jgi:hypothetical protein
VLAAELDEQSKRNGLKATVQILQRVERSGRNVSIDNIARIPAAVGRYALTVHT